MDQVTHVADREAVCDEELDLIEMGQVSEETKGLPFPGVWDGGGGFRVVTELE
jgi:hypothetical protein